MKNINEEDREFYELFDKYEEAGLIGFYELFVAWDNKPLLSILRKVYKEKTGENLKKEMLKDLDDRDISIWDIGYGVFNLSDEQLNSLDTMMYSAYYQIFQNPDIDPYKKFDENFREYLEEAIDVVREMISQETDMREEKNMKKNKSKRLVLDDPWTEDYYDFLNKGDK